MKFVSELICFIFVILVMSASSSVNAVPRTDTDDLYSEAIYMHRTNDETPGAFESSARLADEGDDVDYFSTASDTMELEPVALSNPVNGKKLSARPNRKKSSRN